MNNEPLLSAIITTYKREPSIVQRAALSVINQTYKNIELIVVDDSPYDYAFRDEVKNAVLAVAPSTIYILNDKNVGACESRNIGARAANGDIIGFLDDDDEWCSEKVEKMMGRFIRPEIGLVYCGAKQIDEQLNEKEIIVVWKKGHIYQELLFYNFIGSTSFPLIRKNAFFQVGGFDYQLRSSQDHDMWLRLSKENEIDYVKEPLVKYYLHKGEQITKNTEAVLQGQQRIYNKYFPDIKKERKVYWKRTIMLSSAYGKNHKIGKAILYWLKSIIIYPIEIRENLQVLYFSIMKMI